MLRRLRRGFRRSIGRLGPLLVTLVALTAAGLGTHAALDWHHHGEVGGGFFHLHVHFGEHRHPGLDDHGNDDPGDHGLERPGVHDQGAVDHHHDEVGDHHDGTADHDHAADDHRRGNRPDPGSSSEDRRENGTLTHVLGITSAPKVAPTERPTLEARELASNRIHRFVDRDEAISSWSPRGPPV